MFSQDQLPWPASERKTVITEALMAETVATEAIMPSVVEPILPYDTVDLEMWPQTQNAGETRFRDAVREAALVAGGELLFDLPAEGLVADRLRIAVARIPDDDDKMRVVLATLDQDGAEIHLQMPDAATAHLVGFAEAFVGLFQAEALVGLFHQRIAPEADTAESLDLVARLGDIRAALDYDMAEPAVAIFEPQAAAA
jgi:hypothetical protein